MLKSVADYLKVTFIRDHREEFEIVIMCEVLDASRGGFYDWLTRDPIAKDLKFQSLKEATKDIFRKSRQTYGTQRAQLPLTFVLRSLVVHNNVL